MALPTGTSRGSGLSRSEAAILAWKKRARHPKTAGGLDPKIAARVKEILAGKQKKGKGKGKGKTKAPGKNTPEQKNKNRAQVAKQTGMGDLEGPMVRLAAGLGKEGAALEKDANEKLVGMGLAKRHADGSMTLSPAGKKWRAAADKGDADGANAAISDAKSAGADRAAKEQETAGKKAEREKAKAGKLAERAAKHQKQQQAQKQKANARKKIAAEKAKARAAKDAAKLKPAAAAAPAKPAPPKPAATPAKPTAKKALDIPDLAIKQSDEERAMFAKMGGGRGKGKGYDKKKSTLTTHDDKAKGGGGGSAEGGAGGGGAASSSSSTGASGGGPGGRATLRAPVSGDMEAHAQFVAQHRAASAARAEIRGKARANIAKIDAIQKELKKRNTPIARLRELQQQLSDIRSGKAIDMSDLLAIKAGARHSKMDASHLDEAARHLHAAGATCPDCAPGEEEDGDEDAAKAIKGIMDNPAWYAQHECSDIMQAGSALSTLAMLIGSELSEEDEDDAQIKNLCDAADTLIEFIQGELSELRGAAGDAAEGRTAGDVPMAKAVGDDFFAVKSIGDSDEVSGPAVRFGSSDEPDLSETRDFFTKSTNYWLDSWDKRPMLWHHTMPQVEILQTMKEAGAAPDEIKAMREAIIYLEDNPVIGVWTKATIDPVAVWMNGQLDRAHKYRAAVKRMIELGMLKISTDSAPHLVRREKQANGTHEVKRWPIVAASLTPSAAEPRLFDVKAIQSWYDAAGITIPFVIDDSPEAVKSNSTRHDGVEVDEERARRLSIQQRMIHLRETMNGLPS